MNSSSTSKIFWSFPLFSLFLHMYEEFVQFPCLWTVRYSGKLGKQTDRINPGVVCQTNFNHGKGRLKQQEWMSKHLWMPHKAATNRANEFVMRRTDMSSKWVGLEMIKIRPLFKDPNGLFRWVLQGLCNYLTNPEFSTTLVPSTKHQWVFSIGFWGASLS